MHGGLLAAFGSMIFLSAILWQAQGQLAAPGVEKVKHMCW